MREFDWDNWILKIEEAANKNEPLEIDLPKEEWERLKETDLADLKKLLSDDAAGRLILIHGDIFNEDSYYLLVARYCRCRFQEVVTFF